MIDYVTKDTFERLLSSFGPAVTSHDTRNYEDFYRLHDPLVAELSKTGKIGGEHADGSDSYDFYHTGDWFNTLSDSFLILSERAIRRLTLIELQKIVEAHSPHAVLTLEGELETPLSGLRIAIHSKAIIVCWEGFAANQTRERLKILQLENA